LPTDRTLANGWLTPHERGTDVRFIEAA